MKTLLLVLLSLMTGCESGSELNGCTDGWVKFTCRYPEINQKYTRAHVDQDKKIIIQSSETNKWEHKDRFHVYHDTNNKNLTVVIRQLEIKDSGKYTCKFKEWKKKSDSEKKNPKVTLEVGESCQKPVTQTAYRTAQTTISCDNRGNKHMFFCKDNGPICEDISSNRTFALSESTSSFNMSISGVSSQHAGVYWCGLGTNGGSYRAALRKIQLEVKDITTFTKSPAVGQTFSHSCEYPNGVPIKIFICKGEDPSRCETLVTSDQRNNKRFIMEDKQRTRFDITVINVTAEDSGTYWCGAETSEKTGRNQFFHRFIMTVVSLTAPSTTSSAPPGPVTPSFSSTRFTASAESRVPPAGRSWVAVVVCLLLLGLLLISVLSYKRFQRSRNKSIGEQQNHKDRVYEEIQERPQKPNAGTALKTIYATASAPTIPSGSQYYSTIDVHSSSGEAAGETFSTVKDGNNVYSTVDHPAGFSENPLYSSASDQQQH